MKTRLNMTTMSTTICAILLLASCRKEISKQESMRADPSVDNLTYTACNLAVNVFTPQTITYNLAFLLSDLTVIFGIPGVGELSLQNVDEVTFEFSGQYADKAQTVKLYRIKRSDGKYLSNAFGAASYTTKIEGGGSSTQLFILNSLGNNRYNIILPTMSTCNFMFTYYDTTSQKYRGAFVSSGQQHQGTNQIALLPTSTITPNTK